MTPPPPLAVEAIDDALPQTQCTRCGYPDCRAYAQAIAAAGEAINRCPPGGAEGIERLARLTGRPALPLDPTRGSEGPLRLALIDEDWCIGCTLCIQACPVDCIVGAPRLMHTVVEDDCTGCELCVPACPVDCIVMQPGDPRRTGWAAWSPAKASASRTRYAMHRSRIERERRDEEARLDDAARAGTRVQPGGEDGVRESRRALVDAALQRARARAGGDAA